MALADAWACANASPSTSTRAHNRITERARVPRLADTLPLRVTRAVLAATIAVSGGMPKLRATNGARSYIARHAIVAR